MSRSPASTWSGAWPEPACADLWPDDSLIFVPLGGSGEIGMNLNLYGHQGRWLMVDLGIGFGDETTPGVDIVLPDPAFIRERRGQLAGLVLTHAHEDHLGAVPYLWSQLECPVYARPFTASVLKAKLHERGLVGKVPLHVIEPGQPFPVGPFTVEMIPVTHSVPEASMLAIRTSAGLVVHTGDWKLDPEPLIGRVTDTARLQALGREGVRALVCDSTNVMVPGHSGSEAGVRENLQTLFARFPQRIAVTCFATNVARVESIAAAAVANDRSVALVGRSLWRIYEAAKANGYFRNLPAFLAEHEAGYLPRDRAVLICTGSQGEPRSALARIAHGDHPEVSLEPGDTVLFSSKDIPGNERAIGRVQNWLVKRGIGVVTAEQERIHVSGHPGREELQALYRWLRPELAVPVHGEERHLVMHGEWARVWQTPEVLVPHDGQVIRLAPGPATVLDTVHTGRLVQDGKRIIPLETGTMKSRHRMMHNGAAVATVVLNGRGELVTAPQIAVMGLLDPDDDHDRILDLVDAVREAVAALPRDSRLSDQAVREAVRITVRRAFNISHGKKPLTDVHLIRI